MTESRPTNSTRHDHLVRATLRGAALSSTKVIRQGCLDRAIDLDRKLILPAQDSSARNSTFRNSSHLAEVDDESCVPEEALRVFSTGGATRVSRMRPILQVCDLSRWARKTNECGPA